MLKKAGARSGSLLERTIRHASGCPKCARVEGYHVFVLTVSYAGLHGDVHLVLDRRHLQLDHDAAQLLDGAPRRRCRRKGSQRRLSSAWRQA
jgi:hypothetical protein